MTIKELCERLEKIRAGLGDGLEVYHRTENGIRSFDWNLGISIPTDKEGNTFLLFGLED